MDKMLKPLHEMYKSTETIYMINCEHPAGMFCSMLSANDETGYTYTPTGI